MSKKTNVSKIAEQDAYDFALAEMFFGEGAAIRRKLIRSAVKHKDDTIPGYRELFDQAFSQLNQVEIAEKALAERKKIDAAAKAAKNLRAIKTGNLGGLTNGLFLAVVVGYGAHALGLDELAKDEAEKLYKKAKTEIKFRRMRAKGLNVEKLA